MSLYVYGDVAFRQRFIALVRDQLGQVLGRFLELENNQGPRVRFSEYVRDASGSTDVQRRFFQFIDSVVRDAAVRVEIEIVEDRHPPHFGQAFAPRQRIDIGDLEAIAVDAQAFTRAGVITHEIAERWWMVRHGYVHRAVLNGAESVAWQILWFDPAHEYALRREAEVTGWRQVEDVRRPGAHQRIVQNGPLLQVFEAMFWGPGGAPEEVSFVYTRRRGGWSRPARRRVDSRAVGGLLGPRMRVQEIELPVPNNGLAPGPVGVNAE
jgi:hypothetical protein